MEQDIRQYGAEEDKEEQLMATAIPQDISARDFILNRFLSRRLQIVWSLTPF